MPKDFLKFNIKYELKDNGDTTQNLFVKTYQNSSLISERDFGNICEIVKERKFRENLIKYLEDNINHYKQFLNNECMDMTQDECKRCTTRWTTYLEILERIKNNNYD